MPRYITINADISVDIDLEEIKDEIFDYFQINTDSGFIKNMETLIPDLQNQNIYGAFKTAVLKEFDKDFLKELIKVINENSNK